MSMYSDGYMENKRQYDRRQRRLFMKNLGLLTLTVIAITLLMVLLIVTGKA